MNAQGLSNHNYHRPAWTTLSQHTYRGYIDGMSGDYFDAASIRRFSNHPNKTVESFGSVKPDFIVVACDPNAGGANHTALVALVLVQGQSIVRRYVAAHLLCRALASLLCPSRMRTVVHNRRGSLVEGGPQTHRSLRTWRRTTANHRVSVDDRWGRDSLGTSCEEAHLGCVP